MLGLMKDVCGTTNMRSFNGCLMRLVTNVVCVKD